MRVAFVRTALSARQ